MRYAASVAQLPIFCVAAITGLVSLESSALADTVVGVVQTSYDAMQRPVCSTVRMNPSVYGSLPSDACALSTTGTFGPDRITKTVYDAAGQVTEVDEAYGVTTANGFSKTLQQAYVAYKYTPDGKQQYVTDANGNRAQYVYDGYDRLYRWYFPDKTTAGTVSTTDYEQYGYDASGNRTSWRTRAGTTITYGYDALNRQTIESRPGNDIHRTYDLLGQPLKVYFTSTTSVAYTWDALGDKLTETRENGWQIKSGWDAAGNRLTITHPDGQVFTYGYDAMDRMTDLYEGTTAGQRVIRLTYDQLGRRSVFEMNNQNPTTYGYDGLGRLTGLFLDPVGSAYNVLYNFTYNPADQVVTRTSSNDRYAYGGYLNVSRSYVPNGLNQYKTAGSATFSYDADGNLTSDGTNGYSYNEQRVLYHGMGPSPVDIGYDPTWRITTTSGGASGYTGFLWDGDQLVAEYDSSGKVLRRYVYGPGEDEPWMWYEGSTVVLASRNYLHADAEGSIVAITNGNGNATHVNAYDEWGVPQTGNVGRFGYTGQAWLPDLGMYDYKARIYSPTLGRFLQTDPIGYKDQMNLYAYVGNDPVDGRDPTGLWTCTGDAKSANCNEVRNDIALGRDALRSNRLSVADKSDLAQVLSLFGREGDKTVTFTFDKGSYDTCTQGSSAEGCTSANRLGQVDIHLSPAFDDQRVAVIGGLGAARLSDKIERVGTVFHEGRHGYYAHNHAGQSELTADPRSHLPAYHTEDIIHKAYGTLSGHDVSEGCTTNCY